MTGPEQGQNTTTIVDRQELIVVRRSHSLDMVREF